MKQHTCSYYCERPECIRAQRDELRDRLEKVDQGGYETTGYALAARVLQSDLYAKLDDRERAECDHFIAVGQGKSVDHGGATVINEQVVMSVIDLESVINSAAAALGGGK